MTTRNRFDLVERVYNLCNREQYFTCGTNSQYDKMFNILCDPQFDVWDVTLVIWACSEDKGLGEIYLNLKKEYDESEAEVDELEREALEERRYEVSYVC